MPSYTKEQQLKRPRQPKHKAWEGKESVLQSQCEEYLKVRRIPFSRVPDAAYRSIFAQPGIPLHIRSQIASCLRGLPDLTIYQKDGEYNRCLMVELKTARGRLSQSQKHWAEHCNVAVVRSFEDFQQLVDKFIG